MGLLGDAVGFAGACGAGARASLYYKTCSKGAADWQRRSCGQERASPHGRLREARESAAARKDAYPMPNTVLVGAQWGDEGKGKDHRPHRARLRLRGPLPGRQQRRPHGHPRRQEAGAAPRCPPASCTRTRCRSSATAWWSIPACSSRRWRCWRPRASPARTCSISCDAHVIMPYHKDLDGADEKRLWARTRSAPPSAASAPATRTRWRARASASRT